jgi:hypothetical protein
MIVNKLVCILYNFFIAIIFLYSCTNNSNNKVLLIETERSYFNFHEFKPCRTDLIIEADGIFAINYFSQTNKRIEIRNLENEELFVIDLPDYIEAQNLHVVNIDTIILFNNRPGEVHLITKCKGYNKTILLENLLPNSNYRFYNSSVLYESELIITGYKYPEIQIIDNAIEFDNLLLTQIINEESVFIFTNLFGENPKGKQKLKGFIRQFIVKNAQNSSSHYPKVVFLDNNKPALIHANSDYIYIVDEDFNKQVHKIKLKSEHSALKVPLLQLYSCEKGKKEYIKQRQESIFHNGIIYNVTFDKYRNLIYVTTLLPNLEFNLQNNLSFERDWTIILLDTNYNQLGEFFFNKNEYCFQELFPTKDGILLKNQSKSIKESYEFTQYTLFKIFN